jgi:cytochrome P450
MATTTKVDLTSHDFRSNPYPLYEQLRRHDPVHFSDEMGVWFASSYAHAFSILRDPRWSNDHRNSTDHEEWVKELEEVALPDMSGRILLFMDPPDHTRLRGLVRQAFTPAVVENLKPRIRELVGALLTRAEHEREFDLIRDFAYPLPVTVIAEMLGIPAEDRDMFREHSRHLAPLLDWDAPIESLRKAAETAFTFIAYLIELIEQRRAHPKEDLISALVAAEQEGERLNHEELVSLCLLLFVAGHETTMNLIGNGTLALLRHPDALNALRAEPEIARTAVEELLRYDSPVQLTARTALADVEVGDKTIPRGQQMIVLLSAANRDPAAFSQADGLDLRRADNHHLSFGHGGHFCLGASLARVEGAIAFAALAQRFERIELLTDEPEWRETITLRGLKSLPLRVE